MWKSLDDTTISTLKALWNVEPSASTNFAEGRLEGGELDHYIGVTITKATPDNLKRLEVPAFTWSVFPVNRMPRILEATRAHWEVENKFIRYWMLRFVKMKAD